MVIDDGVTVYSRSGADITSLGVPSDVHRAGSHSAGSGLRSGR